jgi:hypothetical protein
MSWLRERRISRAVSFVVALATAVGYLVLVAAGASPAILVGFLVLTVAGLVVLGTRP